MAGGGCSFETVWRRSFAACTCAVLIGPACWRQLVAQRMGLSRACSWAGWLQPPYGRTRLRAVVTNLPVVIWLIGWACLQSWLRDCMTALCRPLWALARCGDYRVQIQKNGEYMSMCGVLSIDEGENGWQWDRYWVLRAQTDRPSVVLCLYFPHGEGVFHAAISLASLFYTKRPGPWTGSPGWNTHCECSC